VLAELARVSRRFVVASFFDAASLPAWRHRVFGRRRARHPIARRQLDGDAAAAGLRLRGVRWVARGLSEQAIALLERAP
jgi:hypothetical protein